MPDTYVPGDSWLPDELLHSRNISELHVIGISMISAETADQILDEFLTMSRMCQWCAQSYCMVSAEAWKYCSPQCYHADIYAKAPFDLHTAMRIAENTGIPFEDLVEVDEAVPGRPRECERKEPRWLTWVRSFTDGAPSSHEIRVG